MFLNNQYVTNLMYNPVFLLIKKNYLYKRVTSNGFYEAINISEFLFVNT